MGRRKPPGMDLHHSKAKRTPGSGPEERRRASRHGNLEGHTKKGVSAHGRRGRGAHAMHPHSTEGLMTTVREAPASKSADFCNARFSTKVALAAAIAAAVLSAASPQGAQAKPVSSVSWMEYLALGGREGVKRYLGIELEHEAYRILPPKNLLPFKGNLDRNSLEDGTSRYEFVGTDKTPAYMVPLPNGKQLRVVFDCENERIEFFPPGGTSFYLYYHDVDFYSAFSEEDNDAPSLAVSEDGGKIDVWLFSRRNGLSWNRGERAVRIRFGDGRIDPESISYTHYAQDPHGESTVSPEYLSLSYKSLRALPVPPREGRFSGILAGAFSAASKLMGEIMENGRTEDGKRILAKSHIPYADLNTEGATAGSFDKMISDFSMVYAAMAREFSKSLNESASGLPAGERKALSGFAESLWGMMMLKISLVEAGTDSLLSFDTVPEGGSSPQDVSWKDSWNLRRVGAVIDSALAYGAAGNFSGAKSIIEGFVSEGGLSVEYGKSMMAYRNALSGPGY